MEYGFIQFLDTPYTRILRTISGERKKAQAEEMIRFDALAEKEYPLIIEKKSQLSRFMRDKIVGYIENKRLTHLENK